MDLREHVGAALRTGVGPALGLDGSQIEVVEVADGIATLRLGAVCAGCPASIYSLLGAIEVELKARVPAVELVEAVG